jgi:hypothetical protein
MARSLRGAAASFEKFQERGHEELVGVLLDEVPRVQVDAKISFDILDA